MSSDKTEHNKYKNQNKYLHIGNTKKGKQFKEVDLLTYFVLIFRVCLPKSAKIDFITSTSLNLFWYSAAIY